MTVSHFRDLEVWRLSMSLAAQVYQLTAEFPKEEKYGLSSQLQRAAVSIPSNIAEGNARHSTREYARFVSVASGSTAELMTQLLLAQQFGFGHPEKLDAALAVSDRVGKMLLRLHRALLKKSEAVPESPVPSPESRPGRPQARPT